MCSLELRLEIISGLPFFASLSKDQIHKVNQEFVEHGYQPGEMIYFTGEPAQRLYIVAAGKVKLVRHTSSGRDVLLDVLKPGEFFGTLSTLGDEKYDETAVAHTASCTLSIDSADFRRILQRYPHVSVSVLDVMASRLKAAQEMVQQLSAQTVEQRIAHTLVKLADKLGEKSEVGLLIQLPLSRDDLAMIAGTTIESASRTMSKFQKEGLVRSGRQWVAITDLEQLRAISQEE